MFHALVLVLLAQAHDRAQRLHVVAVALGLGVDVADVVGDRLLLFLEPLDALDEGLELILGEIGSRLSRSRWRRRWRWPWALLASVDAMDSVARCEIKAECASSTVYARLSRRTCKARGCMRRASMYAISACGDFVERGLLLAARFLLVFRLPLRRTACRRPLRGSRPCRAPTPVLSASSFIQLDRQLRQKPARFIRSMFCTSVRVRRCSTRRRKTAASSSVRVLSSRAMGVAPPEFPT